MMNIGKNFSAEQFGPKSESLTSKLDRHRIEKYLSKYSGDGD